MFSAKHLTIGRVGETVATKHLISQGYTILTRNYRKPWGEIDIISKAPDKTLVFIEVKALKSDCRILESFAGLSPEDNLTQSKLKKLKKVCEEFANHNSALVEDKKGWRIDLLTVILDPSSSLTNNDKNCVIKHYQNIG